MIKKQILNVEAQTCAERSRSRRRGRILWLIVVLMCVWAVSVVPVFAGGWATTTIDSLPDSIKAGETARIEFTILQHDKTPVHTLQFDGKTLLITPVLTAKLAETTLAFEAQPAKVLGHWFVDVTLPRAGAWEWSISPDPLAGVTQLEPLMVEPAVTNVPVVGSVAGVPVILGLVLIGLVIAGFIWWRGRETAVAA